MAWFMFICDRCRMKDEVICQFMQLERMTPVCQGCGEPMRRDFMAEGASFVGRGYPFVDDGITGTPIEVRDYAHHKRLLRQNQMDWHEPKAETKYRRKHIKDLAGGGR